MSGDDGLREAIAEALISAQAAADTNQPLSSRRYADAVLALPEVAALRAKAAAADRVRELADALGNRGHTDGREIRRALDGDGS